MKRNEPDNLNLFLSSLGKIYTYGINLDLENISKSGMASCSYYSIIGFTRSMGPFKEFCCKKVSRISQLFNSLRLLFEISVHETGISCVITLLKVKSCSQPLVWRRVANHIGQPWNKTTVHFEKVRFHRPTLVSETSDIKFTIRYLQGSREFLVFESNNLVCSGKAFVMDDDNGLEVQDTIDIAVEDYKQREFNDFDYLSTREIYKLRIRGYDYGSKFQGLHEARNDGVLGKWRGHFISFMDSMLHISLVAIPLRALFVPVGFDSVRINPKIPFSEIERVRQEKKEKESEEYQLKEFLYFSDKSKENKEMERNFTQCVENLVKIAEMTAILKGIEYAEQSVIDEIHIFSDLMSSLQAISNRLNTHPIVFRINESIERLNSAGKLIKFHWIPAYTGIEMNERDDALAELATSLSAEPEYSALSTQTLKLDEKYI